MVRGPQEVRMYMYMYLGPSRTFTAIARWDPRPECREVEWRREEDNCGTALQRYGARVRAWVLLGCNLLPVRCGRSWQVLAWAHAGCLCMEAKKACRKPVGS